MNEKALRTLEFNKIVDKLTSIAISPMGKELASQLMPSCDIPEIEKWQNETTDAVSCILRKGSFPLGGIKDIREALKRADMGGMLSIPELMDIGETLYVCRKVKNYVNENSKNESYVYLEEYFNNIVPLNTLEHNITSKIVSEQELADDASPELLTIRREMRSSGDKVREQLNNIIHSQDYKTMLQDNVITIRGGRYCVPIKQEYKNAFNGMIHDQSSTGATLFIEPIAVVQINNKIKELQLKEKNEIEKILRQLSAQVCENSGTIRTNIEMLTHLDFLFAKGSLSLAMNGTRPVLNNNGCLDFKKARHPLLDKNTVVPTNVYLGKDFTTLLITGPNTGGKTVALKTIGLLTLIGQAGLHIPASDHSELAVFDEIFADIGDEQSIEQSLSTFSSHMSNIVRILDNVTPNSLVLFDELGAGTDPVEGAALAMSIINYIHNQNIRLAVTTHYSELKVFAISTERVENASCEFDVETLRPTYKLLIGIPGKSNAFAISKRLGLQEHIISDAKEFLSHEDARFEDIITDLEISKKSVEYEQQRAEQYRRESENLKKDLERQKQQIEVKKEKILSDSRGEARQYLQAAKDEADQIIKDMLKLQRELNEKGTRQNMEEAREKLKGSISKIDGEQLKDKPKTKNKKPIKTLSIGDRVYIYSFNQSGIVSTLPDKNGEVYVKAGIMKLKVNISDLSIDESEKEENNYKSVSTRIKSKSLNIKNEIDCRGLNVEETLDNIDKYIDDAFLAGLSQVTIIHGKGTGTLRQAVHQFLGRRNNIASYRLGKYGEGETGVTIVELSK